MTKTMILLVILATVAFSSAATADVLRFTATGHPDVTGYVEFDDTNLVFDTCESNTNIIGLDLDVTVGVFTTNFSLSDVTTGDDTVLVTLSNVPMIENGCGNLATSGDWVIGFWPDGWDGSPSDGDAALRVENATEEIDVSLAVQWVAEIRAPAPVPTLSVWALMLLILAAGAIGTVYARSRLSR